ncbi:MAG: molybdopterin dinucleotide binding domain-containing protein [Ilumatobacteraceae bacterium]
MTNAGSPPSRERRCSGRVRCTSDTATRSTLVLQSMRSHDQFNTTIYGLSDRYGIEGGRRVVFVNPADLVRLGLDDGELVDVIALRRRVRPPIASPTGSGSSRSRPRSATWLPTSPRPTSSST